MRKRKGEKQIPKIEKPKDIGHFLVQKLLKFGFLRMPESKCRKTRSQWQEIQAVVMQVHF